LRLFTEVTLVTRIKPDCGRKDRARCMNARFYIGRVTGVVLHDCYKRSRYIRIKRRECYGITSKRDSLLRGFLLYTKHIYKDAVHHNAQRCAKRRCELGAFRNAFGMSAAGWPKACGGPRERRGLDPAFVIGCLEVRGLRIFALIEIYGAEPRDPVLLRRSGGRTESSRVLRRTKAERARTLRRRKGRESPNLMRKRKAESTRAFRILLYSW